VRRFYAPPEIASQDEFVLPDAEGHHASRVLRCRVNDEVVVVDGVGQSIRCKIAECSRSSVRVIVLARTVAEKPKQRLVLMQGIVKGKAMDLIVEKATELGVAAIVPVVSENAVAVPDSDKSGSKVDKWWGNALAAIKQCGRAWLPEIAPPTRFDGAIQQSGKARNLVASLQDDPLPLYQVAESLRLEESVNVWIGPEGDFTNDEYRQLDTIGATSVSLSDAVLRSETAAICALSCLRRDW